MFKKHYYWEPIGLKLEKPWFPLLLGWPKYQKLLSLDASKLEV